MARLGDNRKFFRLLHKATITRGTVSEMMQDSSGVPSIQATNDRLIRWKEFFEVKLNHDTPSILPGMADPLTET